MSTSALKETKLSVILMLIFGMALLSNSAYAATLTVSCSVTDLVAKITQANGTPESDTLELTSDCLYSLTAVDNVSADNEGSNGLPIITTEITIRGNSSTIERAQGSPQFRLFDVSSSGNLTIEYLILQNGHSSNGVVGVAPNSSGFAGDAPSGGAILTRGNLSVLSSRILNNQTGIGANQTGATGGSGAAIAALSASSNVYIDSSLIQGNETGTTLAADGSPGSGGAFLIRNNTFLIDRSAVVDNNTGSRPPTCCSSNFSTIASIFPDTSFSSRRTTYSQNGGSEDAVIDGSSEGFFANGTAEIEFSNNTFFGHNGQLIKIADASVDGVIIRNNLFEDNGINCEVSATALNTTLSVNNLFDATSETCGLTNGVNGNLTNVSAGVEPLAENGGLTPSHNLPANSPARDRYDYDTLSSLLGFIRDQRGYPKYGNDGGTVRYTEDTSVDIGAIEAINVTPLTESVNTTNNELAEFGRAQDWYSLVLEEGDEIDISISFIDVNGDLDMRLFAKNDLNQAQLTSTGFGDIESFSAVAKKAGEFWLVVYGFGSDQNVYDLNVTIKRNDDLCFPVVAANNNISLVCL